jgi:Predicted glycosylase
MRPPLAHRVEAELRPDPARVIARLFLPGEETYVARSRAGGVVARVLALDETEVEVLAAQLLDTFGDRHRNYPDLLARHASIVARRVGAEITMSSSRTLLLGATFTSEYATEGAALCNPSAVPHPDQHGLEAGAARVALSLRAIGEGHLSSIVFSTAIVGPGPRWRFEPRPMPAVAGVPSPPHWQRDQLRALLADRGELDELASAVVHALPTRFTGTDLEAALARAHHDLLARPSAQATAALLRRLVSSAYEVRFDADVSLDQQVLLPSTADERNGMEDARFTRFTADDGAVDYRATYTAYDGERIAPRLLVSPDLHVFRAYPLAGPAVRNKGIALFPRLVDGRHLALCRADGESTSLASSPDGHRWTETGQLQIPHASWELLGVGNCGPPIETDRGWLVLTHGIGPMRTYSIGALLLDLHDPRRIVARLERPLLKTDRNTRDGYVPNVVYSCGSVLHDGRLWLPYGLDDTRVAIAWASVDELLDAMIATA